MDEYVRQLGSEQSRASDPERWVPLLAGSAIALFGLTRKSATRVALFTTGAAIAYAGAKAQDSAPTDSIAESSTIVNVSPQEAFSYWRDFENLGTFMHHIESVHVTDERNSRWTAIGPLGQRLEWDAEITGEVENELIAWRSLPGSDIEVDGQVEFSQAPGDRGTLLNVRIHYSSPVGRFGKMVAKLVGKDPNFLVRQDLRRFKALLEASELPTTEGQSHGPRDAMTGMFRMFDPDRPLSKKSVAKTYVAKRRAS
jgi:uncharacterized membrane protein